MDDPRSFLDPVPTLTSDGQSPGPGQAGQPSRVWGLHSEAPEPPPPGREVQQDLRRSEGGRELGRRRGAWRVVSWSSGGSTETGSQGAGEGRATGHSGSGPCVHCPILHCSRSQQGRWGGPHRTLPSRLSLRQAGDRGCGSNLSLGPELMAHRESLFPRSGPIALAAASPASGCHVPG